MTETERIEKQVARDILSMIELIYFSKEYSQYRFDYGSNGARDLLIGSIRKRYDV